MSKNLTIKDEILRLLEQCSAEERFEIFRHLRREFPIHQLEADLNTQAEIILEAMARSSDLTMRGIRGIIAEAAFLVDVLQKLKGWQVAEIEGDAAYDFLIEDALGQVSIQVKMQRRQKGIPLVRNGKFVVETQRTRTGKDAEVKQRGHIASVSSTSSQFRYTHQRTIGIDSRIRWAAGCGLALMILHSLR